DESEETNRGGERAEEDGAAEPAHGSGDGVVMRFAVTARLLITSEHENGEIDAEPDQNGAESDGGQVQALENENADGEGDKTGKQKRKAHPDQRQPALKTDKKDGADQKHRADQSELDVAAHAQ